MVLRHGFVSGKPISNNKENFALNFMNYLIKCRFLFDKYIIKREYANESADGEWNQDDKSRTRHKDVVMLQAALRVSYTSPKVMHWITDLLVWLYQDKNRTYLSNFKGKIESIAITAVRNNYLDEENWTMGVNTLHIIFNYLDCLL